MSSVEDQEPIRVTVTGAGGAIGYALLPMIASGQVFGKGRKLILQLLEITDCMTVLDGVVMELEDSAVGNLVEVIATDDPEVAFKDADVAFLVGAMPRKEGMERKDLLAENVKIFQAQGAALEKFAKKNVKVLVVGNPANTNALICAHYAPSIPKCNISAMTRLDHNRARAMLAKKLDVNVGEIKNVIVWGNHSSTQYPDCAHATVSGKPVDVDNTWVETEFLPTIQHRGAAVIAARKFSSAVSAAKAAADHMRDWFQGTPDDSWTSMAVPSDGSYNVPVGLIYSFPVTISNGKWDIVQGLAISEFARGKLDASAEELMQEREEALQICKA